MSRRHARSAVWPNDHDTTAGTGSSWVLARLRQRLKQPSSSRSMKMNSRPHSYPFTHRTEVSDTVSGVIPEGAWISNLPESPGETRVLLLTLHPFADKSAIMANPLLPLSVETLAGIST